jgi:hypothetical protein
MKTAAGRFLLILCFSTSTLWAGPTGVETQKTGSASATTGLTGGVSTTGNNSGLGSGSLQQQQSMSLGGTLGTVTPTPQVGVNPSGGAAPVLSGGVIAPQSLPQSMAPAVAPGLTRTPVSGTDSPAAQTPADNAASPAVLPQTGLSLPGQAAPSQQKGASAALNAGQTLQSGAMSIRQGAADEAAGMGEMAVHQALDRIFDASRVSVPQAMGPSGVSGAQIPVEDKIQKTVALANTSAPRNAPDLYVSAIKTAEDALPAPVAGMVKAAVLDYASRKAVTALPDLANEAYQAAAGGAMGEVRKAFASFDKWEKLLGKPGQPLVANRERLEGDVQRVLDEGAQAVAQGRAVPAPRIWFTRAGLSFSAVLPTASVAAVPADLSEALALKDAVAAAPFYLQALTAFQARPSFANGLRFVYQANRSSGRSAVGSAWGAAAYGFKAFLARLWHAVRDFILRLAGRAPATGIAQGFSVTPSPALAKPARSDTVSLAGTHLQLARVEAPLPAWQGSLKALNALQAEHASAEALLSREAPLDMQSARTVLGLASAMAGNHAVIAGEDSASAVVRSLSGRLEQMAREDGLGPRSPLPAAMLRLVSDPEGGSLRQWLDRIQQSGQERILAITGAAQANLALSRPGGAAWALSDLSGQSSAAKGRISGSGLRAAANLFLDAGSPPQGSFAVMDQVLLGRWDGAQGRGKVLAVLAPAAQGGGARILYENPAGISAAAKRLAALGFSVEVRGQALSASLSAQASDAGGAALAAAMSQAVNSLQTGQEPVLAVSGAGHADAAAQVRKLVSDLKRQKASAAAVAQTLQSSAPESLRLATIGRVDGLWAQSGRLVLDDGRTLTVSLLKDPESGLFTAARAEVSGPGEKSRALAAAELGALLSGE